MFTHIALPFLPQVPEELYADFLNIDLDTTPVEKDMNYTSVSNTFRQRIIKKDGKEYPTRTQRQFNLGTKANQWVFDTLFDEPSNDWFVSFGISFSRGAPIHGPHSDPRRWALFYLVDRGGEDAHTSFWLENGNTVEREGNVTVNDYSRLTLIDRFQWPLKQWVLFNPRIIHSVEHLESTRKSLQITCNFLPEQLQELLCSNHKLDKVESTIPVNGGYTIENS
jgi:hypothetical protein